MEKIIKLTHCELDCSHGQSYNHNGKEVSGDIFDFGKYTKDEQKYFRFVGDGDIEWLGWHEVPPYKDTEDACFIFDTVEDEEGKVVEALYDYFG